MAAEDERQLALANALAQIERQFGKGSIMRMGDFQERMAFEVVPTARSHSILALGVGGLPRGRIVEIYGPESSGKDDARLARHRRGAKDRRHRRLHRRRARARSQLCRRARCRSRQFAGLAAGYRRTGARDRRDAHAQQCGRRGRRRLGRRARDQVPSWKATWAMRTSACRRADVAGAAQAHRRDLAQQDRHDLHQPAARKSRRHVRQSRNDLGRPRAQVLCVRFARRSQARNDQSRARQSSARARASRSSRTRCAPPFRQAEFDITYGHGISKMGSILDVALEQNIVGKSGSWYTYGEQRIGQGRENAKAFLEEHSISPARSKRRSVKHLQVPFQRMDTASAPSSPSQKNNSWQAHIRALSGCWRGGG
jgi:recombination protein RecA